jgi:hypothetical protein
MAVITISRLAGALGDTLAAALAERLQYRLVERAQLMQLCEQLVGSDLGWERSRSSGERSASLWGRLNASQDGTTACSVGSRPISPSRTTW